MAQTLEQVLDLDNRKRWRPDLLADDKYDMLIDARGLACPMPLIKTRQALMVTESGTTICLLATDPTSKRDVEMFIDATGHKLLRKEKRDDVFLYVIQKVDLSGEDF